MALIKITAPAPLVAATANIFMTKGGSWRTAIALVRNGVMLDKTIKIMIVK